MIKAIGMAITDKGLNLFLFLAGADGRLLGGLRMKAYLKDFR
jgi:multisubunit Na+/H+ antiporter MnhC subunit